MFPTGELHGTTAPPSDHPVALGSSWLGRGPRAPGAPGAPAGYGRHPRRSGSARAVAVPAQWPQRKPSCGRVLREPGWVRSTENGDHIGKGAGAPIEPARHTGGSAAERLAMSLSTSVTYLATAEADPTDADFLELGPRKESSHAGHRGSRRGCLPFPGIAGYRQTHSASAQDTGRGGRLQFPRQPSDRSTPSTPGGSSASTPRSQTPSLAFTSLREARLPLVPVPRVG